jgi:hypothetical protein
MKVHDIAYHKQARMRYGYPVRTELAGQISMHIYGANAPFGGAKIAYRSPSPTEERGARAPLR